VTPPISVVILTKNSMPVISRLTSALARQTVSRPWELIVMDNASTDGTVDFLRDLPFADKRVIHVPEGQFSHSRTRMQAAEAANGELVVFFTDDIVPVGETFLENLVRPVADDRAEAAYGVHMIHPEWHDPIDARLHNGWESGMDDVSEPLSEYTWAHLAPAMRRRLCNFDNCASCIRRDVLLEVRFPDVDYGEDMLFAKRLILSGRRVALAKNATFYHWHKVRYSYMQRRMCIDAHLSRREFGLEYVSHVLGIPKAVGIRVLHRAWIGLFHVRGNLFRRMYWILYNARILTADFTGKYIGALDETRLNGVFSPLKKAWLRRQRRILFEIEKKSIRRY
jgi:rhamnosyltransferase